MSYVHDGRRPAYFRRDPVDPDCEDEVFFVLDPWIREDLLETLIENSHVAFATGATILEQPRAVGPMQDTDGTVYHQVFAVRFSVNPSVSEVSITHRKSTVTAGIVNLGRTNHDHTIRIPVRQL